MRACTSFSKVGRHRQSSSSQLTCQVVEILLGKAVRKLINIQSQFVSLLPNIQLPVTLDHHYSVATFVTAAQWPCCHYCHCGVAALSLLSLSPCHSCHFCHCGFAASHSCHPLPATLATLVTAAQPPCCHFCHGSEAALPLPHSGTLPSLLPGPGLYLGIFKAE